MMNRIGKHKFALIALGIAGTLSSAFADPVLTTPDMLATVKNKSLVNFGEISDYLQAQSGGFIQPVLESRARLTNVQFRVNADRKTFEHVEVTDPNQMSLSYTFDLAGFAQKMGSPDFLTAKSAYYNNLVFNQDLQAYQRDYITPDEWKSLFFPPQHELTLAPAAYDQRFVDRSEMPQDSEYFSADWHKKVDGLTNTQLTFGNELEILSNGLSFDKKLELVKSAQKSIYVGVMAFVCDSTSRDLLEALKERRKAGVDVRVMLEGVWTEVAFHGCMHEMRKADIEVILATDLLRRGDQQDLFHNKIWIFDENVAIMGGENIINSDSASTGFNAKNRDVDLLVKGPAVTEIMQAYVDLYHRFVKSKHKRKKYKGVEDLEKAVAARTAAETASGQRGQDQYEKILSNKDTRTKGVCRFVIQGPQGPNPDRHRITTAYVEYIKAAKKHLLLTSGKMRFQSADDQKKHGVWGNTLLWNAVHDRASAGVWVDAISNGTDGGDGELSSKLHELGDKWQSEGHFGRVQLLNRFIYSSDRKVAKENRDVLESLASYPNTRTWTFFQYYHGKTIDFDRTALAIGSYNLEDYSAEHSHESTLICQDDKEIAQQDDLILRDLVNSTPVLLNQYSLQANQNKQPAQNSVQASTDDDSFIPADFDSNEDMDDQN